MKSKIKKEKHIDSSKEVKALFATIQDEINAALPGGTVTVPPGTYNEQLVIDKALTLQGSDPAVGETIIDATGMDTIPTIEVLASNVTIRRLTIENGPQHGIQVGSETFPDLDNIVITENTIRGHGLSGIITMHSGSMKIIDNTIENNGVTTGFRAGIYLFPHGETSITDNILTNNNIDGIFARASDSGLTIENNTIENHSNSGITLAWDQVNTSILNNTIDKGGTGTAEEQGGIVIIQSMAEVITGNTITNCDPSGIFWGWTSSFGPAPTEILIQNNTIDNSIRDAIYLFSQGPGGFIPPDPFPLEPTVTGNTLTNSGRAGVYVSNEFYFGPGNANPTINFNDIEVNQWGVFNATANIINAINNWWGDSSGPFHPTLNPQGTGEPVSDRVDFIPWLEEPPVIEIIECRVGSINLENHAIEQLYDKYARVNLIIKVKGSILLETNGEETETDFSVWFIKSIVMKVPTNRKCHPLIIPVATCHGALIEDDKIQVEACARGQA